MSSKQHILNSLKKVAVEPVPMPEINIVPRTEDLVGQFETNLKACAGILRREGGLEALQSFVDDLMKEGKQIISFIDGIESNREIPATPHELRDIDFAIIPGDWGVAENGAIWVCCDKLGHRITPFICENLILTVEESKIVPNMHEVSDKVSLESGNLGVYIAGPSKTADIEQALVVGAHGACSLNVYLL